MKAFLVYRGVGFPFTHNISLLLELCGESAKWAGALDEAERLTCYAVTTRYPGCEREVTESEARQAIDLAAGVREVVRTALVRAGMSL